MASAAQQPAGAAPAGAEVQAAAQLASYAGLRDTLASLLEARNVSGDLVFTFEDEEGEERAHRRVAAAHARAEPRMSRGRSRDQASRTAGARSAHALAPSREALTVPTARRLIVTARSPYMAALLDGALASSQSQTDSGTVVKLGHFSRRAFGVLLQWMYTGAFRRATTPAPPPAQPLTRSASHVARPQARFLT